MAKAKQDFDRPICVSVCDRFGFLIAVSRMEGAPVRSIEISRQKAYSATRMSVSTSGLTSTEDQMITEFIADSLRAGTPG